MHGIETDRDGPLPRLILERGLATDAKLRPNVELPKRQGESRDPLRRNGRRSKTECDHEPCRPAEFHGRRLHVE